MQQYGFKWICKRWANIITITENQVTYWVWIPKYVYSLDTTNKSVNTCFVTKDTTVSTTEYSYKTKEGDKTVSASEYQMPESFTFAGCRQMETSGGVSGLFGFTYYDGRITTWRSCCCCLWCRPLR